jgi:DNA polymerase III, delta subunit
MVYKKKQEHAFIKIGNDIKKNKLGNVVVLCGVEQYLVKWAADLIVRKYVNEAVKSLDYSVISDDELDFGHIMQACETMPMMSQKRVVMVSDLDLVWRNEPKYFPKEDVSDLLAYLSNVPDTAVLVITAGENPEKYNKSDSKMMAAAKNAGSVYDFDLLDERQLRGYLNKRLAACGKQAGPGVLDALIWESGYFNQDIDYALFNLENDLKKMVALSAGNEITMDDFTDSISDNLEHNTFKMIDAISQSRKQEAFRLLHDLMLSGTNAYMILATLCNQIELMLETKELRSTGKTLTEIKKETGISSEYRIKKAMGYADKFERDDLKRILISAFEVDDRIKSGLLDDSFALEMFIAQV